MSTENSEQLTPEGLRMVEVSFVDGSGRHLIKHQEIGFEGCVIFEDTWADLREEGLEQLLDDGRDYLVNKVLELHKLAERERARNAPRIELAALNRNRKLACRRFRRWYKENALAMDFTAIQCKDSRDREILCRVVEQAETDVSNAAEEPIKNLPDVEQLFEFHDVYGVHERLLRAPCHVLVVEAIPSVLVQLLTEIRRAYGFAAFGLAIVGCRAVLEEALKEVVKPKKEMCLEKLLNAAPLPQMLRSKGHDIRKRANDLLHRRSDAAIALEAEAWDSLFYSGEILKALFETA